ncbi:hypothetical protein [Myroides fluvii]|uniref:hypothetical protein n=1 Tax=Myroides fluvii TaxID=2572594 RepID=UPI00131D2E4B|nr:hypothetical protein [Myroides fluvii]
MNKFIQIQIIVLFFLMGNIEHMDAQSKVLKGTVMDSQSKMGIEGVLISTSDRNSFTLTNSEGDFEFTVPEQVESIWFNEVNYQGKEVSTQAAMLIELELVTKGLEEIVVYTKPIHAVFGDALQKAMGAVNKGDLYKTYVREFNLVNGNWSNVADGLVDFYIVKPNKRPYTVVNQNRVLTSASDISETDDFEEMLGVIGGDVRDALTNTGSIKTLQSILKKEKDYNYVVRKQAGIQQEENLVIEFSPKENVKGWQYYEGYVVFTVDQQQLLAYNYTLSKRYIENQRALPVILMKIYFNDITHHALYKESEGVSQLTYLFTRLDCDMRSKVLGNNRMVILQDVVVDQVVKNVTIPENKINKGQVLFDKKNKYQTEFWKNRNIRLLSSREEAVLKKMEETNQSY